MTGARSTRQPELFERAMAAEDRLPERGAGHAESFHRAIRHPRRRRAVRILRSVLMKPETRLRRGAHREARPPAADVPGSAPANPMGPRSPTTPR